MGQLDSPLGTRTFESTSMEHFTVEDASDGENHSAADGQPQRMTYEEAMALRQQRINDLTGGSGGANARPTSNQGHGGGTDGGGPARPTAVVKRRIEMLIGVGRQTIDVKVPSENGEVTFSMRTLKSKEMREIMQLAAEMAKAQSVDTPYAIRERTLALAIFAIDGADVDLVLGVSDRPMRERLATRLMLLDEMNEHTLNHLYREHEKMAEENAKLFGVKSAEDAKEVASQIKKSGEGA